MRSPRRGMCAAILSLEAITLGLTTPVLITIADVPTRTALGIGLGLMLACLLLAGMLRGEWAYWLGWAIQLVAIGLGAGWTTSRPRAPRCRGASAAADRDRRCCAGSWRPASRPPADNPPGDSATSGDHPLGCGSTA